MKAKSKLAFLERYIRHLWRCYRSVAEVRRHLDSMMTKLYNL